MPLDAASNANARDTPEAALRPFDWRDAELATVTGVEEHDLERCSDRVFGQTAVKVVYARYRHAANADDEISQRDSRSARGTSLLDVRHQHRTRRGEVIPIRLS